MYKRNVSFCSYTVFNDRASTLVTGQLLCSLSNAIFQAISLHCRADLQHTVSASSRSCISIPLEEACDCSAVICIHVHETLSTAFVTSTMSARMTICLKGYLNITCVLHQVRAVFVPTNSRRKEKKRKEKKRKEKKRKEKKRKEKKRKDYTFRHLINEKPSVRPSCPGPTVKP